MNKGTLDRTTFEAIEAYVLDRMSATERAAFDLRLASEPDLRAELELERENIRAVELGGLQRALRSIALEERDTEHKTGGGWGRFLAYAASIAVLLSVAIWWFASPPINERLYAEHFSLEPGLPVTMGATDDPAFADAMVYYKEGRYTEAAQGWAPLLQQEPTNDTLLFYMAMIDLAMANEASAVPKLSDISERTSIFKARARWYLFLVHVKREDLSEARSLQMEKDTMYGDRAARILSQLGE